MLAQSFKIGNRRINRDEPAFFIAEIGSNHGGSMDKAQRYVAAAAEAGADAAKIQVFRAESLVNRQLRPEVFERLRQYQVSADFAAELTAYGRSVGLPVLATPFDPKSLDMLAGLGVPALKIASGDMTYYPLLRAAAATGLPLLLSTGLADLEEVAQAVEVFLQAGGTELGLLHCTALYPTPLGESNIRAVSALGDRFQTPVGLSDHSLFPEPVLAARALGAVIFEKHVTFDREAHGPDHSFALTFGEFKDMITMVRRLEECLGRPGKEPSPKEKQGPCLRTRRGLYAARDIAAGALLEEDDLAFLRPVGGLPAEAAEKFLGKRLNRPTRRGEPLREEDFQD